MKKADRKWFLNEAHSSEGKKCKLDKYRTPKNEADTNLCYNNFL